MCVHLFIPVPTLLLDVLILCILLCEDFPLPPFHGSEIIDYRDDLEINPLVFSRLFPLKPKRCFRDTCQ